MTRVEVVTELDTITCYKTDCGIQFAVPVLWLQNKRRDHSDLWCPNGHGQAFLQKSKEEQLKEELAKAKAAVDYQRRRGDSLEDRAKSLQRSVAAQRGQVTRLRNKAIRGECGFCHHQFADVAAHVQAEHPSEAPEESAEGDDS